MKFLAAELPRYLPREDNKNSIGKNFGKYYKFKTTFIYESGKLKDFYIIPSCVLNAINLKS